ESGTSGWEHHRILLARCRARGEAVATIERGGPWTVSGRHPLQPHESLYAARAAERATRRAKVARIARGLRGSRHYSPRCGARDLNARSARRFDGTGGHVSGEPAPPHRAVRDREQTALRL